ncbi:MAG: aminopeptidase [Oscillospiraceae bacterium]
MDLNYYKHKYAEVLIKIGIALKEHQLLCIEAPIEQSDFVSIVAEEAYKAGCSKLHVIWKSDAVDRVKVQHQTIEVLDCDTAVAGYYADNGAGYIRLDCPDINAFKGISPEKINEMALAETKIRSIFRASKGHGGHTIACVPCKSWADMVFPDVEESERMDALWDAVLTCVRCKEADPVGAWRKYIVDTGERKAKLNEKQYQAYRYSSGKTDLTISPVENHRWNGGCIEFVGERVFVPNIPTEEVFTVPHKYKVNGHVASTMPLNYRGQIIDDFVLWFENGRISKYEAKTGEELLKAIIDTDEGTHYIGEMAFIDQNSPIASLHRIFYTTLYDENASCHIAIGFTFGPYSTPEENDQHGYNSSKLHVDFMVGSNDMSIKGQLTDGSWEDIFIDGKWAW